MLDWFKNTNQPPNDFFDTAGGGIKTVFWVVVVLLVLWIFRPLLVAVTRE